MEGAQWTAPMAPARPTLRTAPRPTLREAVLNSLPRLIILPLIAITFKFYFQTEPSVAARGRASELFTSGRFEQAHREFEKALTLLPDDSADALRARLLSQSGVCLVSLGRRRDAADRFEAVARRAVLSDVEAGDLFLFGDSQAQRGLESAEQDEGGDADPSDHDHHHDELHGELIEATTVDEACVLTAEDFFM